MLSCFSRVWLLVTLGTVACQAPLSMGVSRQEHWSGLPCPPPGDFPNPGIEPGSLMSPALAGGFFTTWSATWKAAYIYYTYIMHITICVCRIYIYTFFLEYSLPFWFITRYSSLSVITVSCCFCSVMPCNHLILCHSFSSCLQSFPASGSFLRSQFFKSDGQRIGVSASVLPKMKEQKVTFEIIPQPLARGRRRRHPCLPVPAARPQPRRVGCAQLWWPVCFLPKSQAAPLPRFIINKA